MLASAVPDCKNDFGLFGGFDLRMRKGISGNYVKDDLDDPLETSRSLPRMRADSLHHCATTGLSRHSALLLHDSRLPIPLPKEAF